MNKKYVLTVKVGLHLGYIKETFGAGAVIEHDEENNRLIIDGRKFDETRDLDILIRQAQKFPNSPWIVPYSQKAMEHVVSESVVPKPASKPRPGEHMRVIKSDQDLTEEIDISSTKISKINRQSKEDSRKRIEVEGMPIIRGDETVQERLAALKDKSDLYSVNERVRLKSDGPAKMPVVHDDSLGMGIGRSEIPMNAGQVLHSREAVEAKTASAKAAADARKREVEETRSAAGIKGPENTVVQSKPKGKPGRPRKDQKPKGKPGRPRKIVAVETSDISQA